MKSAVRTNQTESNSAHTGKKSNAFFKPAGKQVEPFFAPAAIQPKLEIGQPNDHFEKQADHVADAVVQMPDAAQPIQRQEEEEAQTKLNPVLQRKCTECEERHNLQTKKNNSAGIGNTASESVSKKIKSGSGTGQSMPKSLQSDMSQKIGADFSNVNIHTDSEAAQMNQSLSARAFTFGNDVYFNSGEYNPSTKDGRHLLAHELTHVVQQNPGILKGGKSSLNTSGKRISKQEDNTERQEQSFEFPGIDRMMTTGETQLHIASLAVSNMGLAATLGALVVASTQMDITIGVGVQLEGAAVVGAVGSIGYVIHDGRLGFYGSYGGDIGAVVGISAELVFTVIDGGLDRFSGTAVAAVFGGGEIAVGHVSILMPTSGGGFLGIALSGGIGIGLTPIEAYITISNTHAPSD